MYCLNIWKASGSIVPDNPNGGWDAGHQIIGVPAWRQSRPLHTGGIDLSHYRTNGKYFLPPVNCTPRTTPMSTCASVLGSKCLRFLFILPPYSFSRDLGYVASLALQRNVNICSQDESNLENVTTSLDVLYIFRSRQWIRSFLLHTKW